MMNKTTVRPNRPTIKVDQGFEKAGELAVGTELMIAFSLGAIGWYGIVRAVEWIVG